jgi:hypothetical protein
MMLEDMLQRPPAEPHQIGECGFEGMPKLIPAESAPAAAIGVLSGELYRHWGRQRWLELSAATQEWASWMERSQ